LLTLEAYLRDGMPLDREDIAAIERVLSETAETIEQNFNDKTSDWPYEIGCNASQEARPFSQSTTAMMIHAIDLLREAAPSDAHEPYPLRLGDLGDKLEKQRVAAFGALVAKITSSHDNGSASPSPPLTTWSGTYGTDDPLTLSFLSDILPVDDSEVGNQVRSYAVTRAKELLKLDPAKTIVKFFDFSRPGPDGQKVQRSTPLTNAFVPLRVIRACKFLNVRSQNEELNYLLYFESILHDQLSYSAIPDSRFDPAELIFCLEGLLRLSEQSVDRRLFDRVLDVLEAAQNTSAHWRPNKPFLRNERGLVLFPVSVEAANSLRWSCATLDKNERFHSYSERYIALFRRFWDWLAARRVTLGDGTYGTSGWHSDHVADPDSIQLWDTAQVVGFLLGYRRSLYHHIARTTLRLSRFNVRKPDRAKQSWSEASKDLQHDRSTVLVEQAKDLAALRESFEPVVSLKSYFETYRKVEVDFLIDWLKGRPRNYSMLLYGPPGTGKTSVAENLADALGFRLITITVSDFLAGGGGEVEARAKMIFDVLEAQANVVILFDEIDELVLDRSSKRHGQQDTVFKFMTPGMLTKLNNLRRAKRSIFIMATNYAYRIDPAIRRTGRIDENYLLLPPDASSRQRMLTGFLKAAVKNGKLKADDPLCPDTIEQTGEWKKLQDASFFLGYKDMEAAVGRVLYQDAAGQVTDLERELQDWGRTTTLRIYNSAFSETEDHDAIKREFLPLVEMATREGKALDGRPLLDNVPLFKPDGENRKGAIFANEAELKNEALEFVKARSSEYDRT